MQGRGLLAAAVVLIGLSGALYWSNKQEAAKVDQPDPKAPPKILEIHTDNVNQVDIVKEGVTTTIARKDGKWEITAPKVIRADQSAADYLAGSFTSLTSEKLIEEKVTDLAGFGLDNPKLTVIITKKDGKTAKLLIGDDTPIGGSAFVKLENEAKVYAIAGSVKATWDKTAKDLMDKRLLAIDSDKLTKIELIAKGQIVEFNKDASKTWMIVKPKPHRADGGLIEDLVKKITDAKPSITPTDEEIKKFTTAFAGATPVATVKVTDAAGTQQLEIRQGTDKSQYAKSTMAEGAYMMPADWGEFFAKPTDAYRNKKLFDFGFKDVNKIVWKDGDKSRTLDRKDDKWWDNGKQMDFTSVQSLTDKLRELTATKFVETGFTTASIEVTVGTEKILISQTGERFLAQRAGEATLYELDKTAVSELRQAAGDVKAAPTKK